MPLQARLHPLNYTHTHAHAVPPRFDDGSLPPRRVSTGRRFEPRPFSTFTYLLRPLVTPPPWPLAYRPWNSRRIGKYSICTRGETSPPCTYVIRGRMPASGVFIALARCFPSFPRPYLVASLLVISFETGKPTRGKEPRQAAAVAHLWIHETG